MVSQNKSKAQSKLTEPTPPSCNEKPELIEKLLQAGVLWSGSVSDQGSVNGAAEGNVLDSAELKAEEPLKNRQELTATFGVSDLDRSLPCGGLKSGSIHEFFSVCDFRMSDSQSGAAADSLAAQNYSAGSDYFTSYAQPYPPCTLLTLLAGSILEKGPGGIVSRGLRSTCEKLLVWIDRDCWPTPYLLKSVFASENIFTRCIFLDPPNQRLRRWCLEASLASPAVAVVVAKASSLNFTASRRLALLAKKASSLGLLIRPTAELHTPSSAATRWAVSPASSIFGSGKNSAGKTAAGFTGTEQPRWELRLLKCRGGRPSRSSWILEQVEGTDEEISLHLSPVLADRAESPQAAETA